MLRAKAQAIARHAHGAATPEFWVGQRANFLKGINAPLWGGWTG